MATVQTTYNPQESCRELADHVGKAYDIAAQMRRLDLFGRIEKDKELVEAMEQCSSLLRKLEYSVITQIYSHLTALSKYAQDLIRKGNAPEGTLEKIREEMETIKESLDEVKRAESKDAWKADYLRHEAAHLGKRTKKELKIITRKLHRAGLKLKVIADRQVIKARKAEEEAQKKLKEAQELKKGSKKAD